MTHFDLDLEFVQIINFNENQLKYLFVLLPYFSQCLFGDHSNSLAEFFSYTNLLAARYFLSHLIPLQY